MALSGAAPVRAADETTQDQPAEAERGPKRPSSNDQRATLKLGGSAPGAEEDGFRPTKVTIPLEPPDALKSELDQLRKEFKERLRESREARGRKDGQRGGRKDSD
ncbi:MAG TPA: hypothetical protein ENK57_16080 [Polyangiaceae bacterium]|nr:hypothetical protein [Polyangiaceae bacterium]